jgi:hypothetical protein
MCTGFLGLKFKNKYWFRPGCRVPGAGCRVPGAGCRVPGAGCRVPGAGCRVPGAGCVCSESSCRVRSERSWASDKLHRSSTRDPGRPHGPQTSLQRDPKENLRSQQTSWASGKLHRSSTKNPCRPHGPLRQPLLKDADEKAATLRLVWEHYN